MRPDDTNPVESDPDILLAFPASGHEDEVPETPETPETPHEPFEIEDDEDFVEDLDIEIDPGEGDDDDPTNDDAQPEVTGDAGLPAEASVEDRGDVSDVRAPEPGPSVEPGKSADYVSGRTFADFPIGKELLRACEERGYRVATQVQAAAIEPALAGRDLIVRAKTGTGKTAAFCIPILERLTGGERVPKAIVLTPTRELALQVGEECAALARYKDLRVCVLYGGVPIGPQMQALKDGVEIVVGTPGRVLDHLRRGTLDLSHCVSACLDEADEMLSMGFLEEVTHILDKIPPSPQIFLFSATVGEKVAQIVKRYLKDPEGLYLSSDTDRVEGIRHILYETTPDVHKVRVLLAILALEEPRSALIFCNTREDASTVANYMDRQGLDAQLISGELPQKKRESVMEAMKQGRVQFLVATDVAARGIDISNLSHVVHYSLPEDPAIYLHRTGRTGRIGKAGTAIVLAGGTDLSTRKILERDYAIEFETRQPPSPDEAIKLRLERQTQVIKDAAGLLAFESYLGMVRALRERPDGDVLLATALRAFFLWDRQRRAAAMVEEPVEPAESRSEPRSERRDDGRGRGGGRHGPSRGRRPQGRGGR